MGEWSNRFSFFNVDKEGAILMSDGRVFHTFMWQEKKLLDMVDVQPMDETSLTPEDLVLGWKGEYWKITAAIMLKIL